MKQNTSIEGFNGRTSDINADNISAVLAMLKGMGVKATAIGGDEE